jgi:hypothetical protein
MPPYPIGTNRTKFSDLVTLNYTQNDSRVGN